MGISDNTKSQIRLSICVLIAILAVWFAMAHSYFMARHPLANDYVTFSYFWDVMTFSADIERFK